MDAASLLILGTFIGAVGYAAVRWNRTTPLTPVQLAVLEKYAIHYQRLHEKDKKHFQKIVSIFIYEKDWVGAGISIADEMQIMISACAAQLLIGFPNVVLKHFEKIVVYPRAYRSTRSGRMHQGEVRPQAGVIVISWEDFLQGYSHSRDAHNVGLHEMAHALWFENSIMNGEDNFLHPELLQDWIDHADAEIERIRSNKGRLFRAYAGTNQPEFFAVAVEYFYEQPDLFRKELPELYGTLNNMLQQDPTAL